MFIVYLLVIIVFNAIAFVANLLNLCNNNFQCVPFVNAASLYYFGDLFVMGFCHVSVFGNAVIDVAILAFFAYITSHYAFNLSPHPFTLR